MTDRQVAPFGSWPSPITAEMLVEESVRLSHLTADNQGRDIYWVEGRPAEGGREVLVSMPAGGGQPVDVTPSGFSVRTQVHEYGGRCFDVRGDLVVFSNWADQRLWVIRRGSEPEPLTDEPDRPRSVRYADPVISPDGQSLVCVREVHSEDGRVDNDLVALSLEGGAASPRVVASGHDFYSSPRLSPDGSRLCWLSWDLPDMPWDATELWVSDYPGAKEEVKVAGGPGESVTQPRWSPSGVLHYISDRTGWWNLYDENGTAICAMEAEFADPDWQFGNASYGFAPGGELVATWSESGLMRLGRVGGGRPTPQETPFTRLAYVRPIDGEVFAIAGSPTEPPAVVRIGPTRIDVLRRSLEVTVDREHLSRPEAMAFPTSDGDTAHMLFYRPTHASCRAPEGERPPLVVMIHGGPTSATSSVLNLGIQYWTNRGFAVADVDYRGSSGYGRAYRQKLDGRWGVADVADCAAAVDWLDAEQRVDGRRAAIRGGSAGGFTTLAALAFTDRFATGASLYGVADLELLARDTHKFESRYLDRLVGPWPQEAGEYRRRSPIHHVDQIDRPLILFQGLEDQVVPPAQAELMFAALRDRGVPVAYLPFEGEQHGFRKAETVVTVMKSELEFYGRVLGFTPADPSVALAIENEGRLPPRS